MRNYDPVEKGMVDDFHKILAKDKQLHEFWHILPDSGREAVIDGWLEWVWQMVLARGTDPRPYGKTFQQFGGFIISAKAGKRIEFHGPEWVAMDRTSYDELRKAAGTSSE